ncbi:MAG: spore coat U domain-containing protein [Burkholderiales bacterium]|jgi:spore coat protein U-like protein|uniref:Csu type fimbrial protein n=1 Tax=Candidatus Aalborgicola defluviihabitans TaxID=3386187 RepID=UPI001DA5D0F8|nr:spore coat U domain-containing protein [Burkholderiales bacterium]MBK6567549.1 spore coat U domain-containing protein [Burkholderiales bacterium]
MQQPSNVCPVTYLRQTPQLLVPLLACCLLWAMPVQKVHAAVVCTATMTDVNFGSVDLVAGVGLTSSGTLNYTCTNDATTATNVRVCFNIGDGNESLGFFNPRRMKSGANILQFQIFHTSGSIIWGSTGNGTVPLPFTANFSIPRRSGGVNGSVSGSTTMTGQVLNGQGAAPVGNYQDFFSAAGGHTSISWSDGGTAPTNCTGTTNGNFQFTVKAAVIKSCTVSAGATSDIQIGPASGVPVDAVNSSGTNSIGVTCSGGTAYFIGLKPSNNNTAGLGAMSGTGANTDKVPYQLRSVSASGPIWGNTATATSVGNGVAGIGTGVAQSVPVFAVAPSANFTPDNYSDIVTVIVNY